MAGTRSQNTKSRNENENKLRRASGNNPKNPQLERRDLAIDEILGIKNNTLSEEFKQVNDKKATVEDLSKMIKGVTKHLEENCSIQHLVSITHHLFDGVKDVSIKCDEVREELLEHVS